MQQRGPTGALWPNWLGGRQSFRREEGAEEEDKPKSTGCAGNSRGELGLLVQSGAGLAGLDKEESTVNTENMCPSSLELT